MSQESKEEKKPEKEKGMFDTAQEMAIGSIIEGVIPKIGPLIEPAINKISEFIGSNEKIIILRQLPGSSPQLIVLDNKMEFEISSDGTTPVFTVTDARGIKVGVYDCRAFIDLMLTGKLAETLG